MLDVDQTVLYTVQSGFERYSLSSATASQPDQPKLEDGTSYRTRRPTTLDKIKNFHAEAHAGAIACSQWQVC